MRLATKRQWIRPSPCISTADEDKMIYLTLRPFLCTANRLEFKKKCYPISFRAPLWSPGHWQKQLVLCPLVPFLLTRDEVVWKIIGGDGGGVNSIQHQWAQLNETLPQEFQFHRLLGDAKVLLKYPPDKPDSHFFYVL